MGADESARGVPVMIADAPPSLACWCNCCCSSLFLAFLFAAFSRSLARLISFAFNGVITSSAGGLHVLQKNSSVSQFRCCFFQRFSNRSQHSTCCHLPHDSHAVIGAVSSTFVPERPHTSQLQLQEVSSVILFACRPISEPRLTRAASLAVSPLSSPAPSFASF